MIVGISPRARLAESLAAFFLSGYTGISVPIIALGILAAAPFLLSGKPEQRLIRRRQRSSHAA